MAPIGGGGTAQSRVESDRTCGHGERVANRRLGPHEGLRSAAKQSHGERVSAAGAAASAARDEASSRAVRCLLCLLRQPPLRFARSGSGISETITVRKTSFGIGVERIFPLHATIVDHIDVIKRGHVRRAKLYYLRALRGKAARIRERDTRTHAAAAAAGGERK